MDLKLELTVEQQFRLQTMKKSLEEMDLSELRTLLLEATCQVMAKDNIIKSLLLDNSYLTGIHG
jgi:hypothetical protein